MLCYGTAVIVREKKFMMKKGKHKLTLDQPIPYEIKVPGELDANWSDWVGSEKISVEYDEENSPVTIFTGIFDQAALHGFLRRLYALGLPLISVILINDE
jgi:hypothetical protein